MTKLPNFFFAGCQKTASTWFYYCFKEHPEIFVPHTDAIHYFTVNYYRGIDWYAQWFAKADNQKMIGDTTCSYIRDPKAPERIYNFNPEAKIIFSLRNPVNRAFSQYWHQKRKGRLMYQFDDILFFRDFGNYDLYVQWVVSGFYYDLLQNWFKFFPKEQIKIIIFEDLKPNPKPVFTDVLQFLGVNPNIEIPIVEKVINKAGPSWVNPPSKIAVLLDKTGIKKLPPTEYEEGISERMRVELKKMFAPDIEKLSNLLQRDLVTLWQ